MGTTTSIPKLTNQNHKKRKEKYIFYFDLTNNSNVQDLLEFFFSNLTFLMDFKIGLEAAFTINDLVFNYLK